jgi:anti-sigma-K factor RskA
MGPGDETDLHTLAGAYAMDAVGDADRARFEQHLAACDECREEIRGLREATARLAQATAVQPRAELRDATLRAAARTRQLPPAVVPGHRAPRRLAGRIPKLALAAAGALAAAVVVLALMMHGTQHQLNQAQGRSQRIAAVLNATDVTMLTADVSTGGTATVVMSHRQRALVFTAHGLRALPAAQRYELWLMGPAGVRPAGLLPAPSAGMVGPMVISGLAAGDRIGMTVEPTSGSSRPTSPPVLMLGLGSK